MRILVANKSWYRRAGLERIVFDEIACLEEAGHAVAHFYAAHHDSDASPRADYSAPYLEIGIHSYLDSRDKALAAGCVFWNADATRRFTRLLRDSSPDLVHVHCVHRQLSPSIVAQAHRARVAVVRSLHDYHPVCPADDLLFSGISACEPPRCGPVNILPCALYHCVQNSRPKSAMSGIEFLRHRIGEAGRLRAIERFGLAAHTNGLPPIYGGILPQAARRAH